MALTEEHVRYVAELAHLELTDDEVRKFLPQLRSILEYVDKLNQLDTSRVEPMAQVTSGGAENPAWRDDQPERTFSTDEALANAPEPGAGHFKVPQVIERE
ncbi:MAG TPA: Asp-tRNA(Asn)/Glu-tRNA(Gln) amidotransferase subunit GatC [Terriglobia bacterium]|nr:Asp-tRNA(Asn)/Glu-tRNA(Gln) amidotransferase subunit GatC [Terriglobia bacterium]